MTDENEIKIKEFRIRYVGTDPFDKDTIADALLNRDFDEGGLLEIDEVKPSVEICDVCKGIGNLDEGAGFPLDCAKCGGSGYVEVEK